MGFIDGWQADRDIKVGDVVTLKSGGPPMTVAFEDRSLGLQRVWFCVWFCDRAELRDSLFRQEMLARVQG
jgi:uncharacterized protein YodC (DUF2158 family)